MLENTEFLLCSAGEDFQHEKELIELAEHDPGICADLLHLVNTLEYKLRNHEIESQSETVLEFLLRQYL